MKGKMGCQDCDRRFGSIQAFDSHRTGTFTPLCRTCRDPLPKYYHMVDGVWRGLGSYCPTTK